tara:strand:+ start:156 stop:371 length:216 start_codon:yes stop_codon:yes gene_type:complete
MKGRRKGSKDSDRNPRKRNHLFGVLFQKVGFFSFESSRRIEREQPPTEEKESSFFEISKFAGFHSSLFFVN